MSSFSKLRRFTKTRKGFTIIEVTLVLAITGMMFAGLVVSTRHNISSQRFSASVQDFNAFLREVYNQAENVQIANRNILNFTSGTSNYCVVDGGQYISFAVDDSTTISKMGRKLTELGAAGRSACSVYGKLITFGEGTPSTNKESKNIYVYDVIGDVVDARHPLQGADDKAAMKEVHLGIVAQRGSSRVVSAYSHTLNWGAWIEDTTGNRFKGAILIVRSPFSGVIHTYFHSFNESEINIYANYTGTIPNAGYVASNISGYNTTEVNFCVNSEDRSNSMKRRNIRISADARSAADIIMAEQDSGDNKCN